MSFLSAALHVLAHNLSVVTAEQRYIYWLLLQDSPPNQTPTPWYSWKPDFNSNKHHWNYRKLCCIAYLNMFTVKWNRTSPLPYKYSFIMNNTDMCKSTSPFLILMVPAAPHKMEAQTWSKLWFWKQVPPLGIIEEDNAEPGGDQAGESEAQRLDSDHLSGLWPQPDHKTMVIMEWLLHSMWLGINGGDLKKPEPHYYHNNAFFVCHRMKLFMHFHVLVNGHGRYK